VRRDTFRKHVLEVMEDGSLSPHELGRLNQLREALDLDDEQANLLIDLAVENTRQTGGAQGVNFCPHCGKSLVSHQTPKKDDA